MSSSRRAPRNGLAKLLDEADPDTKIEDLVRQRKQFECPACGWVAELRRQSCMNCSRDEPLEPVGRL